MSKASRGVVEGSLPYLTAQCQIRVHPKSAEKKLLARE
jgi:hypothetical protein